jgi:hypothetical protein
MTKRRVFLLFFGLGFLGLYFILKFSVNDFSKVQSIQISLNLPTVDDTVQFGKLVQVENYKDSIVAILRNKGSKETFKRHITRQQLDELTQICSSNQMVKSDEESQITIKYFDGSVQGYRIHSEQTLEKYFVHLFKR